MGYMMPMLRFSLTMRAEPSHIKMPQVPGWKLKPMLPSYSFVQLMKQTGTIWHLVDLAGTDNPQKVLPQMQTPRAPQHAQQPPGLLPYLPLMEVGLHLVGIP